MGKRIRQDILKEKWAGYGEQIVATLSAQLIGKDPAAVTGYLRRGQDLQDQMESLLLRLEASVQNLNN